MNQYMSLTHYSSSNCYASSHPLTSFQHQTARFRASVNRVRLTMELTCESGGPTARTRVDCSSAEFVINENMCFELMMPRLHSAASCLTDSKRTVLLKVSAKYATDLQLNAQVECEILLHT